jgi:DNA-directed RNA polymerase subunit alpha
MIDQEIFNESIDHLGLSTRAYNCLVNAGVSSVKELVEIKEYECSQIKGCGLKTLKEIKQILCKYGLSFGMLITTQAGQIIVMKELRGCNDEFL